MLRYLLSILALVAVVYAAKKRCCVPDQWEGTIKQAGFDIVGTGASQKNITFLASIHVAYDYKNSRYRIDETITTTPKNITIIGDYKAGMMYMVIGSQCTTHKLMGKFPRGCVPKNATYDRSGTLGISLKFDEWSYISADKQIGAVFTVTQKSCVPIWETAFLPVQAVTKQKVYVSEIYEDVTPGIKHSSIFKKPSACSSQSRTIINLTNFDLFEHLRKSALQKALAVKARKPVPPMMSLF